MTRPVIRPTTLRCAIYTRKSSEEGLEQSFNSLHAQREACEAYVKSQSHEGWVCLPDAYDDGGFSGGSMDRPGLKALLADIARRKIDVVVVYKVDRLTRSLPDFARIVETFDGHGVSFVSVTQAFNTTTSMGRLTLNVLLSFAQFEREVTGERIRDKIAASKAKGMWMGGNVPLGYDAKDRTLTVNEAEATQVRAIFRRYLELGSVDILCGELGTQDQCSKARTTRAGRVIGGAAFNRGGLYHLLENRIYRGEITHKGKVYPGLHAAIVDADLFDAVKRGLESRRVRRGERPVRTAQAKLTGRVFRSDGAPLTPTFSYGRGGKAHGYYIAATQCDPSGGRDGPLRIPAGPFEAFVAEALRRFAGRLDNDWQALSPALLRIEVRASDTHLLVAPEDLLPNEHRQLAIEAIRSRAGKGEQVLVEPGEGRALRIVLPLRSTFRGGRTWLTDEAGAPAGPDSRGRAPLAPALKQAHAIMHRHHLAVDSRDALRTAQAPTNPYHRKLCSLATLSPRLQRMLLEGRAPSHIRLQDLLNPPPPILWRDQEAWFARLSRFELEPA